MTHHLKELRPYASTSNVLAVLHRLRSRNLPTSVGNEFYQIAGLPDQAFNRTRDALLFLHLIEEDGTPTERLSQMSAGTDEEYRKALEEVVRESYADALQFVSPETDSSSQIQDWFRRYQPRSQTRKMATLFLGLCKEAGLAVKEPTKKSSARRPRRQTSLVSDHRGIDVSGVITHVPDTKAGKDGNREDVVPDNSGATLAFGITAQDFSKLSDDDFDEVWQALGKVARARANAVKQVSDESGAPVEQLIDGEEE